MKKILISIVILIVLTTLFLTFHSVDRPNPQRLAAMAMLSCGEAIKKDRIAVKDLNGSCRAAISEIRYSKNNQITLYNLQYQLRLTYTHLSTNGKIDWICKGEPKKYFPPQCH